MKKPLLFYSLASIAAGLLIFLSSGTFLILLLVLLIFFFLVRHVPNEDRPFIIKTIAIAFILRIGLMVIYHMFFLSQGYRDVLGPDGEVYSQRGWYISRLLLGENPYHVPNVRENIFSTYAGLTDYYNHRFPPVQEYQIGLISYLIGIFYAAFGYSPLILKLANSAFSIVTGILIYFIGRKVAGPKIGKACLVLTVFLPSTIISSITNLKDAAALFLITALIFLLFKFKESGKFLIFIPVSILAIILNFLRPATIYPLSLFIGLSLLVSSRIGAIKKMLVILTVSLFFISLPGVKSKLGTYFNPDYLFSRHIGYVNTEGNNYRIFPEQCYYQYQLIGVGPEEIMGAFVRGIFHLLGEPLPHRVNCGSMFLAFFQTLLLYLFMPFIILGFLIGLRYRKYNMSPLSIYLSIFIPLIAITEGNVGTVFRHRDILMPFLIVIGVVGFCSKLSEKPALS